MKAILSVALVLLAAGCAGNKPPPDIQVQIVKVAVPVPCQVNVGPEPTYPDTDTELAKLPHPDAAKNLLARPADTTALRQMGENMLYLIEHFRAGRDIRIARDAKKQAAIDKCGEPIPTAASGDGQ